MTTRIDVLSMLLVVSWLSGLAAAGDIRLNEIMYNPPGDADDLQYVELVHTGKAAVDVSGWSFVRGIRFTFPEGTTIPVGGYLVIARDLLRFSAHYGTDVATIGSFKGRLSHGGETVELSDAIGQTVDADCDRCCSRPSRPFSASSP